MTLQQRAIDHYNAVEGERAQKANRQREKQVEHLTRCFAAAIQRVTGGDIPILTVAVTDNCYEGYSLNAMHSGICWQYDVPVGSSNYQLHSVMPDEIPVPIDSLFDLGRALLEHVERQIVAAETPDPPASLTFHPVDGSGDVYRLEAKGEDVGTLVLHGREQVERWLPVLEGRAK